MFDKLNEINDENLHKEEDYENCIKKLQALNEKSQVSLNTTPLNMYGEICKCFV